MARVECIGEGCNSSLELPTADQVLEVGDRPGHNVFVLDADERFTRVEFLYAG